MIVTISGFAAVVVVYLGIGLTTNVIAEDTGIGGHVLVPFAWPVVWAVAIVGSAIMMVAKHDAEHS
jgi:hypothetical protein